MYRWSIMGQLDDALVTYSLYKNVSDSIWIAFIWCEAQDCVTYRQGVILMVHLVVDNQQPTLLMTSWKRIKLMTTITTEYFKPRQNKLDGLTGGRAWYDAGCSIVGSIHPLFVRTWLCCIFIYYWPCTLLCPTYDPLNNRLFGSWPYLLTMPTMHYAYVRVGKGHR